MTGFWDIQQSEKSLRLKIIIRKSQENEKKEKIERKKNVCQGNEVRTGEASLNPEIKRRVYNH